MSNTLAAQLITETQRADNAEHAALALYSRVQTALDRIGDPQHPRWITKEQRQIINAVLDALEPANVVWDKTDEDSLAIPNWQHRQFVMDALYRIDPVDGWVDEYEQRALERAEAAEKRVHELEELLEEAS